MALSQLLLELGESLNLGRLALDASGLCQLVFDGNLVVDIQVVERSDVFYVTAPICPIPERDNEPLFAALLEANLLGQGTGGAFLALDPFFQEIVLSQRFDATRTDYRGFAAELESFLLHLETWKERAASGRLALGAPRAGTSVPQLEVPGPGPAHFLRA